MRKKMSIAAILALCLAVSALCGCTVETTETKSIVTTAAEEKTEKETTKAQDKDDEAADDAQGDAADTDAENAGAEGADAEDEAEIEEETEEETKGSTAVTIEEQVVLEQDGIRITAKSYEIDPIWGDGIKFLVENETDKNITVSTNAVIVNNYMVGDLFYADVAAGKKANETMELYSSELEGAGIETIGQVEIYFHIYNSDTYDTILNSDCITIKTSAFDVMTVTAQDEGTELYNEGGIRIVGRAVDENSFWGTAILLYIENNSGRNIAVSVDDMSINGFMMTPFFSCTVYDGKMAVDDISIFTSDLEENDIESVEDVELIFRIYDPATYMTILETQTISFSAQ